MYIVKKILLSVNTIQNLPILILDFCHLLKGDVLYSIKGGVKFITRSSTPDVSEVIMVNSGENYPITLTKLTPHPVILDFGAHIGSFSLYAWKYFFKLHPKIYSYEPDPNDFAALMTNILINAAGSSIKAFNEAVSSFNGKSYLQTNTLTNDQYFISSKKTQGSKPTKVVSLTNIMHTLKIKHIDILKIDIEGEEYALFNDDKTMKLLRQKVKYIFVESHDVNHENDRPWIKERLSDFQLIKENTNVLLYKNPR